LESDDRLGSRVAGLGDSCGRPSLDFPRRMVPGFTQAPFSFIRITAQCGPGIVVDEALDDGIVYLRRRDPVLLAPAHKVTQANLQPIIARRLAVGPTMVPPVVLERYVKLLPTA